MGWRGAVTDSCGPYVGPVTVTTKAARITREGFQTDSRNGRRGEGWSAGGPRRFRCRATWLRGASCRTVVGTRAWRARGSGVPMLTWPLYAEQPLNAFQLVRELGVAIEMRRWEEEEEEVTSAEEVERSYRFVMEGHVAVKMREGGDEMRELSRKVVGVGGSSYVSMGRFIADLLLYYKTQTVSA
ncbi:hypothetical protein Syun_010538 [Stephania yunnanensis]|uniref:Uncharacterized protein n=1 Tax=Stephania yunnanensis TaxID=152371 RepID=A0AAP0PRR8_9MAGN